MKNKKMSNYFGLLFIIPVIVVFLISRYRHKTFTLDPEESKVHDVLQDILESIFSDGRYYRWSSDEALFFLVDIAGIVGIRNLEIPIQARRKSMTNTSHNRGRRSDSIAYAPSSLLQWRRCYQRYA